jgi:4-hydroxyphenylpyruvate dioxygenase
LAWRSDRETDDEPATVQDLHRHRLLSGALSDKLRAIAAAGYGGAEIFENDLLSAPESAREIGAQMRDLGLACTMFQPFRDLEGLPGLARARV